MSAVERSAIAPLSLEETWEVSRRQSLERGGETRPQALSNLSVAARSACGLCTPSQPRLPTLIQPRRW